MHTCLVGLQNSGKSTALAALWYTVNQNSMLSDWFLNNSDRPKDAGRWSALRDRWLEGKALDRTEHKESPDSIGLLLQHRENGSKLQIDVPDIAGEDFQGLYEKGVFPLSHVKTLNKAEHIVFFVSVVDYDHAVRLEPPEKYTDEELEHMGKEEFVDWTPERMYTGSKLVAVFRGIRQLLRVDPTKITIVLTAWDKVDDDSTTPKEVLRKKFPLLAQYLDTNYPGYGLMGLSAQGCDYDEPESMEQVVLDQIERVEVVSDNRHHDITRVFAGIEIES